MALIRAGEEIMACACGDEEGGPKLHYWKPRSLALQQTEEHELPVVLCEGCQALMLDTLITPKLVRRKARVSVFATNAIELPTGLAS